MLPVAPPARIGLTLEISNYTIRGLYRAEVVGDGHSGHGVRCRGDTGKIAWGRMVWKVVVKVAGEIEYRELGT